MIAIRVAEDTQRLIAALNDGVAPDLNDNQYQYFIVKEAHVGDIPKFLSAQEFRDLAAKYDTGHSLITIWSTV